MQKPRQETWGTSKCRDARRPASDLVAHHLFILPGPRRRRAGASSFLVSPVSRYATGEPLRLNVESDPQPRHHEIAGWSSGPTAQGGLRYTKEK